MRMRLALAAFSTAAMLAISLASADAGPIGSIYACYACQNTGNTTIDAALAANPSVATDGLLFAFINTSGFSITGGTFSAGGDSFSMPTVAAGGTFILMPGITSDGGSHPGGGLFVNTGTAQDTSDGDGGLTDSSIFKFTGTSNARAVTSLTAGSSTGIAGTFTPGDPGLFKVWRDAGATGMTSFIGDGPNGDGGCTNCYYALIATLNTPPDAGAVPEPATSALVIAGLGWMGWIGRRRSV